MFELSGEYSNHKCLKVPYSPRMLKVFGNEDVIKFKNDGKNLSFPEKVLIFKRCHQEIKIEVTAVLVPTTTPSSITLVIVWILHTLPLDSKNSTIF